VFPTFERTSGRKRPDAVRTPTSTQYDAAGRPTFTYQESTPSGTSTSKERDVLLPRGSTKVTSYTRSIGRASEASAPSAAMAASCVAGVISQKTKIHQGSRGTSTARSTP
jgi:hypothetical protein